jgi:hypothetical protein
MKARSVLDQVLSHFEPRSTSISDVADALRAAGFRVLSVENLGEAPVSKKTLALESVTLERVLNEIVAANPGYRWRQGADDLIEIGPHRSVLDERIGPVRRRGEGAWRVLRSALQQRGISLFQELERGDGPPVDLALEDADVRDLLNAVALQLGRVVYHVSGRPGAYFLTISDVGPPRAAGAGHGV